MANLVITIGRENGSGGRQLGSELAEALGVKCYDSELINETAKASGFAESFVQSHEEQRPGSFLYSLVTGGGVISDEQPFPVQIFQAQSEVIRAIAARESCVIVGRCADYILQDKAKCLKVFIHADMAFRAKRIVEVYGEREQSPEQRLHDKDKRRAAYHRFYTNMKWGYAQNYHITLDSGELGIDKCADIIADLYKSKA